MPYFVCRIAKDKTLDLVEVKDKFAEAKALCRDLRKTQEPGDTDSIRMIFAKDQKEARRLLTSRREPSSPLEEWEA